MPNTSKSSKKVTPAAAPEFVDAFTPLYLTSVERVAELQKKSLDIVAEQTADFIGAWKKAFSFFPVMPPTVMFDAASQAFQTAIETQKSAIDLAVEQTHGFADVTKIRVDAYSKIAGSVTATFQKSVERSLESQKKVLDFAAEQNKNVFETTKKQLGASAGPATAILDTLQRGTDTLIEAQKSMLNVASKSFAVASKA
jgi:hypothetical protein